MYNILKRTLQLLLGLTLIGIGIALMVRSNIGLGPWDIFHQGLSYQLPLTIGQVSQAVGLLILAGLLVVRIRVGWGTLCNIILIGLIIDLVLWWLPVVPFFPIAVLTFCLGIGMCGVGSGMYIGAQLGAGPRDSVMLWLSERTGWPIRRVRTGIEISVMSIGWLMGGQIGLGTILFALGIGPVVQWSLQVWMRPQPAVAPSVV